MNKVLVVAATMVSAAAVAATAQPAAAPAAVEEDGQQKVVCRTITEIGSRLNRRRVCRTKAEWDELEVQTRQVVERVQMNKQTTGN